MVNYSLAPSQNHIGSGCVSFSFNLWGTVGVSIWLMWTVRGTQLYKVIKTNTTKFFILQLTNRIWFFIDSQSPVRITGRQTELPGVHWLALNLKWICYHVFDAYLCPVYDSWKIYMNQHSSMRHAAHILAEMPGSNMHRGQGQPKSFWGPGENLIGAVAFGRELCVESGEMCKQNSIYKAWQHLSDRHML